MVTENRSARIGQEAFVLSHDGEVVRTMVAKLEKQGYRFLNGDDNRRHHWFSFEDAVSAAHERISAREATLRKEVRALARKRRALETQNYRNSVINAPYRVVDLRDTMALAFRRLRRTRTLKNVRVPETYLDPGHTVYAIITPTTRLVSDGYGYRPYGHFVLETEVTSVCFSPDGQAHYTFSAPFVVEEFFFSRDEAIAKFRTLPEWTKTNLVHCITSKQEKGELEKLEDDIPF